MSQNTPFYKKAIWQNAWVKKLPKGADNQYCINTILIFKNIGKASFLKLMHNCRMYIAVKSPLTWVWVEEVSEQELSWVWGCAGSGFVVQLTDLSRQAGSINQQGNQAAIILLVILLSRVINSRAFMLSRRDALILCSFLR